ncbi:PA-phosphatase [Nostocales cyanobacterium HT-58-2]|nr:PA-phosphatase [Nostocales cyanobacterium HT-58-2]
MGNYFDKLPNENPLVWAIHTAVKGRARYKVNELYRSEALKRYLESRLSKEKEIVQFRANHFTGNVLVLFHPNLSINNISLLLEKIVLDYRKQVKIFPIKTASISTNQEETKNLLGDGEQGEAVVVATGVATGKDTQKGKIQNMVGSATLPEISMQKQLEKAGSQLVLVSGAVCTLVYCTTLLHRYGLDKNVLLAIQKLHTPLLDRIMVGITFLGDPIVLLLLCLGLKFGPLSHNRRAQANTLSLGALGAIGLNCLLKFLFGRARPALWNRIIDVGLHSFPSGHAMVSIVIYGFLGYILAEQFPQWKGRIFALTVVLILAIGFSRLYLGVHWPTDVVAGYAVGLVWLIACILSLGLQQKYRLSGRHLQEEHLVTTSSHYRFAPSGTPRFA